MNEYKLGTASFFDVITSQILDYTAEKNAADISKARLQEIAPLEKNVNALLVQVGMPNAVIKVELKQTALNQFGKFDLLGQRAPLVYWLELTQPQDCTLYRILPKKFLRSPSFPQVFCTFGNSFET